MVACHDGTIYEIKVNDPGVVKAYERIRQQMKALYPNAGGAAIDHYTTEMLYKQNEEAKWFRLTKKK